MFPRMIKNIVQWVSYIKTRERERERGRME